MLIIDKESQVPISNQIFNSFKKLILDGTLKKDEKLPSVRNIAKDLLVNPNTVHKVYQELLEENLVYSIPQKGLYVNEVPNDIFESYLKELKEDFKDKYDLLIKMNMTRKEILELLE